MALKPDRVEHYTDLSFFMNETAERGLIVTHNTGGSGAAMDDSVTSSENSTSDPVGRFLSTKDADGYAKVDVNINGAVS